MKMNQAEIEKDMVRLKAAVAELEKEFNSNDTTNVLSMAAVHKAEEIEKLARHIRDLVHG
jgi:cell division protein ZapA (FtsZ GTPase activity inhibitor)